MTLKVKGISRGITGFFACLLLAGGCGTTAPKKETGPPPPQNLVGSTDQLQLVTELSLDLAREYGPDKLMVVLGVDGTLISSPEGEAACQSDSITTASPMQVDTAEQVQRIRAAGIPVVLTTKRRSSCDTKTRTQLATIGVQSDSQVLFTDGNAKGPALNRLIESSGQPYPVLIIMADNEQRNLSSVMKEFSNLGTKVHSWRYTRQAES